MSPSGIEPVTFWLVLQYLNQQRHIVPFPPIDVNKNFQFIGLEIPKLVRREVTFTEFSTVTTTLGTTITRWRRSMPAVTDKSII
jgi:hypothetical protein